MNRLAAATALAGTALVQSGAPAAAFAADARLAAAQYVALGFNVGTGIVPELAVSPEVLREEREAAQRIRQAIEAWGRYRIVDQLSRADLVLVIRKGRTGSVEGAARTGSPATGPARQPPDPGSLGGVQFSSPDDLLEVLEGGSGQLIWRATRPSGLVGEVPPLFDALRAEIRKAEASPKP